MRGEGHRGRDFGFAGGLRPGSSGAGRLVTKDEGTRERRLQEEVDGEEGREGHGFGPESLRVVLRELALLLPFLLPYIVWLAGSLEGNLGMEPRRRRRRRWWYIPMVLGSL